MSFLSGKKLLLFGFIVVLLVAIPLTVYLVQQQQKTQSGATPTTALSLAESGTTNTTVDTTVGSTVVFDVNIDPGQNLVSAVRVIINYDPVKLATASAGFVPNPSVFPTIMDGPIYSSGSISALLTLGGSAEKVIQSPKTFATVTFQALATTDVGQPTQISYGDQSIVLPLGGGDVYSENVLRIKNPAFVNISETVISPTVTIAPTLPPEITATPSPTESPEPTETPVPTETPISNEPPVCASLTSDVPTTGKAPLSITLTAVGNDTDGTVSKVTFNWGDGAVEDVTQTGGIGTEAINVSTTHTYNSPGTSFTATAILTDNSGDTSDPSVCSQNIVIEAEPTSPPAAVPTEVVQNPQPTMAPSGPGDTMLTAGAIGIVLTIIGAVLLFAL